MPTKTFERINADKKRKLVAISIDEFARNSYRQASISRIVATAGIAKGSIYQYFSDKSDMYTYLVKYVSEQKLGFITRQIPDTAGFIPAFKKMLLSGAQYDLSNPLQAMLITNALSETADAEIASTVQWIRDRLFQFMYDFVAGQKSNLPEGEDPVLLSVYLQSVVQVIPETLIRKQQIPSVEGAFSGTADQSRLMAHVEATAELLIAKLERGIVSR